MQFPSWVKPETLVLIAYMTLALIQYLKSAIPEKLIPVASLLIAIALAALFEFAEINIYVRLVLYGIFATASADLVYQFFGNSKSPSFTLPSKTQIEAKKPEEVKPQ